MTELLNPLAYPLVLRTPDWLPQGTPADGRLPLAMLVVALLEPAQVVSLGVGRGEMYAALCQAVQELNLATQCVAIELNGPGAASAGRPEAAPEFRSHHRVHYGSFSRLIRGEGPGDAAHFSDGSVDLLHLSGCLDEAEAAAAFRQWRPKLSARAAVLVSDINPTGDGPSLAHFWAEAGPAYPHFELRQGPGLGLLLAGAEPPEPLARLTGLPAPAGAALRELLYRLGQAAANGLKAAEPQPVHVRSLEVRGGPVDAALQARDSEIAALNQTLREQTEHLDQLQGRLDLVMAREREIRTLYQDLHSQLLTRDQNPGPVAERDRIIAQLQAEAGQLNAARDEALAERERIIAQHRAEIDRHSAARDEALAGRDEAMTGLRAELALAQAEIRTIHSGRIWRLSLVYWRIYNRVRSLFRPAPAHAQ